VSQSDKSAYFQALKKAGVEFTKHYREYTTEELAAAYTQLQQGLAEAPLAAEPPPLELDEDAPPPGFFGMGEQPAAEPPPPPAPQAVLPPPSAEAPTQSFLPPPATNTPAPPLAPVRERDPNEMAGQRLNTKEEWEPLRTDEQGRVWFQEEVRKPAFPKPRGRRVLQYTDTGTETKTVKNGEFTETFEVAGTQQVAAQVKITLPSYQVGIYKDRRFPFKIHVYNGNQGFNLFDVQNYYGGAELVPLEVKRMYVENVLCYDIRTTVRAIQSEFRQLQLAGKVK